MIDIDSNNYLDIPKYLNLNQEDNLIIAASLSKLSKFCKQNNQIFNIDKLINSFIEVLNKGSLIIPTFTDSLKNGDTFDVKNTKPTIGALAVETFYNNKFYRTIDPFHSFAVWGKLTDDFKKLNNKSTFGHDSAFDIIKKNNCKMLIIDVDYNNSFTFIHYCEELAKVRWRYFKKFKINIINQNNDSYIDNFQFFTRKIGYINYFSPLEKIFYNENIAKIYNFQNIKFQLIDINKAFNRIMFDIENNKGKNIHRFSYIEFLKQVIKKIIRK